MKSYAFNLMAVIAFVFSSMAAHADSSMKFASNNPIWMEECASCHVAFPPQLLTKENWQRMMGGLDKHFGVIASLDAKDNKTILDFLQKNAGSGEGHSASSLRISKTSWFIDEHHEVSRNTWAIPAVKSRSNCTACHVNAERGDWSEHGVRMPGGQQMEDDN